MPRRRRRRGPDYSTLQRKGSLPVWAQISWRALFVVALLGVAVAVHWFERDGLRDNFDGHISFLDVVYFTMISVTTTGYGDIAPVHDQPRLFAALNVTPLPIFTVLTSLRPPHTSIFQPPWDRTTP